jgi:ectonucleotide pyrophosphatase/phosphodiesterase family protein 4
VRRVDDALRRLRVAVGDAAWNEINVIVVSDHGMAELDKSRAVFLADDPCGVPFHDLHIEGSDVVMHVWPRTSATRNGSSSFPVDPADPSAAWFDARALAEKVDACHAFVKAWTRESVPKRFAYGENRRVGPVVIAADVGWTLCGANASRDGDKSSPGDASGNNTNASYAHERDWSLEHSGCVASLGAAAGHRGAHGFDNDAPEMRAVFIARGPSFRKDGARLLADTGDGHGKVTAATGRDADEPSGIAGADANRTDLDAVAAAWESKTFVIDNTAVFAIASTALGMDAKSVLADGRPFPNVDGVLDEVVRDALFDAGDEDEDEGDTRRQGSRRAFGLGSAAAFLAVASVSFTAFTLIDRRLTGRWPFERARAVLSEMDAEQTLPEMELVGVAETRRSGADG